MVHGLARWQVASELQRLQKDASAGKLGMADLKGGTFSLSNIGNLGGTYTGPVINLPEVAIAGLGKARPSPRYDASGNLVKQTIMQVTTSSATPLPPALAVPCLPSHVPWLCERIRR